MDTLKEVIAQAQKRTKCETPYALGQKMQLKGRGMVSDWIAHRRWPSDEEAARLAELAGVKFDEVIALRNAEKAKTQEERDFWRKFKAHGIAASLALYGLAAPALLNSFEYVVYYVKFQLRSNAGSKGLFSKA